MSRTRKNNTKKSRKTKNKIFKKNKVKTIQNKVKFRKRTIKVKGGAEVFKQMGNLYSAAKGASTAAYTTAKDASTAAYTTAKDATIAAKDTAIGAYEAGKSVAVPLKSAATSIGSAGIHAKDALFATNQGRALHNLGLAVADAATATIEATTAGVQTVIITLKTLKVSLTFATNTSMSAIKSTLFTADMGIRGFFGALKTTGKLFLVLDKITTFALDTAIKNLSYDMKILGEINKECENVLGSGTSGLQDELSMITPTQCISKYIDYLTKMHKRFIEAVEAHIKTCQLDVKAKMQAIKIQMINLGCKKTWMNYFKKNNKYVCKKNKNDRVIQNGNTTVDIALTYRNLVDLSNKLKSDWPIRLGRYQTEFSALKNSLESYVNDKDISKDIYKSIQDYSNAHCLVTAADEINKEYIVPLTHFQGLLTKLIEDDLNERNPTSQIQPSPLVASELKEINELQNVVNSIPPSQLSDVANSENNNLDRNELKVNNAFEESGLSESQTESQSHTVPPQPVPSQPVKPMLQLPKMPQLSMFTRAKLPNYGAEHYAQNKQYTGVFSNPN